jgi:hypothetical protein
MPLKESAAARPRFSRDVFHAPAIPAGAWRRHSATVVAAAFHVK